MGLLTSTHDVISAAFIDLTMPPGFGGLEVAHRVRTFEAHNESIATPRRAPCLLVALTGAHDDELTVSDRAMFDAILSKPAHADDICKVLKYEKILPSTSRPGTPPKLPQILTSSSSLAMAGITLPGVLMVEDNNTLRSLGKTTLESFNLPVAVFTAASAAEALEMLCVTEATWLVVFMDLDLGRNQIQGDAATRAYRTWEREKKPDVPRTKIYTLTGNVMSSDRRKSLQDGADDFISKPARPALLKSLITKALAEHSKSTPPKMSAAAAN